jgi:hypothetical protein
MAHDPRIFVGAQQTTNGNGHVMHQFSANCPQLTQMLAVAAANGMREFTTGEYAAWDTGDRTFKAIQAHGR